MGKFLLQKDIFLEKIAPNYWCGFNPLQPNGVAVFNLPAYQLLRSLKGKTRKKTIPGKLEKYISKFQKANLVKTNSLLKIKPAKLKELGVWVNLTNQCNLCCRYCYIPKNKKSMSWETAKIMVKKVLASAKKWDFEWVKFKFSGGEPLLEFDMMLKIKKLAQKKQENTGLKTYFVVLTNGVLLTEKTCQLLKKEGFFVALSVDGLREYHDVNRKFPDGSGGFAQVEKGLQNLLKLKVPFNITITVTAENIEGLPSLIS